MAQPILSKGGTAYIVGKDGKSSGTVGMGANGQYMLNDNERFATADEVAQMYKYLSQVAPTANLAPVYTGSTPTGATPTASLGLPTIPNATSAASLAAAYAEAQKASRIAGLDKAKTAALSQYAGAENSINQNINQTKNINDTSAKMEVKSFADFLAERGLRNSGVAAQGRIANNVALQGAQSMAESDRNNQLADVANKRAGIESSYQFDVQQALAQIESDRLATEIANQRSAEEQRIADNQSLGMTSTGQKTPQALEAEASTIAMANYDNIQLKINELAAKNPNDPLIPYLQAIRQQKIANMESAKTEAVGQQQASALAMWKVSGTASAEVASILGLPVGAKTADYDMAQIDAKIKQQNADTSRINATKTGGSGSGGGSGNPPSPTIEPPAFTQAQAVTAINNKLKNVGYLTDDNNEPTEYYNISRAEFETYLANLPIDDKTFDLLYQQLDVPGMKFKDDMPGNGGATPITRPVGAAGNIYDSLGAIFGK